MQNTFYKEDDRLKLTLRDIIAADMFKDDTIADEMLGYNISNASREFDYFIDESEQFSTIVFDVKINSIEAVKLATYYKLVLLSGNRNDSGAEPLEITGQFTSVDSHTIVEFTIDNSDSTFCFSQHDNGYSYANYVMYAAINEKERSIGNTSEVNNLIIGSTFYPDNNTQWLLCAKGRIIKSNIVHDLTEGNIY